MLLPLGSSLYYGFTRWDGISPPEWVGLANYARALSDGIYLRSYLNVGLYIVGTLVVEVAFGLVMATLLNSDRRGFPLARVLFFSPMVLSMVAAGLLWAFVYDLRFGLLNGALEVVGLGELTRAWLSDPRTALAAVTVVSGWKYAGFYMIIYLAALRRIPATLYEAARLDGAGPITQFLRITLPLLRETTVVTVLLCVTGGFAAFDLFFAMTNGGPFNATEIPTTWIVKQAFDRGRFGYGIALTVLMAAIVGVLSVIYLRISQRGERVEY
ncbi:MAG: sugar ABC transporter permease [Trueperaceae bacterium]|nr:sugar ABC transporter permease [Trueperaceae bacterium]